MTDQIARLSVEITDLNKKATETRKLHQLQLFKSQETIGLLAKKCNEETEKNKQLQRENDSLLLRLEHEQMLKRQSLQENDILAAELFDFRNLLAGANEEAQRGREYHQQLVKLESEMIIFNDARVKCQQKMEELHAMKARDVEVNMMFETHSQDLQDMKRQFEQKSSQVDGYRARIAELEQQVMKKDNAFSQQKHLITSIKDANEEKIKVGEK